MLTLATSMHSSFWHFLGSVHYVISSLRVVVLKWGQFYTPSPGYRPCLEIFLVLKLGMRAADGIKWVEARDAAKHPMIHRKSPPRQRIIHPKRQEY